MFVLFFAWVVLRGWRAWRRSARHRGVAPRVVPPRRRNAGEIEHDEHVQRVSRPAEHGNRDAIAHRDIESAVSAHRRGETEHGRRLLVGVAHRLLLGLPALARSLALAL